MTDDSPIDYVLRAKKSVTDAMAEPELPETAKAHMETANANLNEALKLLEGK